MDSKRYFHVYDNALTPEFCKTVINKFENDDRKVVGKIGDGTLEGKVDPSVKIAEEIHIDAKLPGWEDVMETILENLGFHSQHYLETWGPALNVPMYPEEFRVTKYEIGGHFNWHSDNIGANVSRVLTAIWYLNDVKEGGETEYPWQDMKVKPKEGSLLICPVGWTYRHRSIPVVSNPKYIIITQIHQKLNEV